MKNLTKNEKKVAILAIGLMIASSIGIVACAMKGRKK